MSLSSPMSGGGIGISETGNIGGGSSFYAMTPEQASREFDSLRREATKLERHLEDRVARYQQVSVVLAKNFRNHTKHVPFTLVR